MQLIPAQTFDNFFHTGFSLYPVSFLPGVGEKTAAKFLAEYGSLENTLANADKIKGAMGEKVKKGKEMAILSQKTGNHYY